MKLENIAVPRLDPKKARNRLAARLSACLRVRLREWRESAGLSVREGAVQTNMSTSQVTKTELGGRTITVLDLFVYARACRRSDADLLRLMEDLIAESKRLRVRRT